MGANPGQIEQDTNAILKAWGKFAPTATFGSMTLQQTRCFNRLGHERLAPGECELRGQEQPALELPRVTAKLKAPNTADEEFEEVVKSAQDAAVLVLVY